MADFTPLPPLNGAALRDRPHGVHRDVVAFLEAVFRRKRLPLMGMAMGLGMGVAMLVVTPPAYKASAQIMIETKAAQGGVLPSEVAIATSTPVLSKVAGILRLYQDPEFTVRGLFDVILMRGGNENAVRDRVARRLERMISVQALSGTTIIDMSVHNKNPDRAAQIANALLAAYQERKVDERFEMSRQIGGWMGKRLETIRDDGDTAKKNLEEFQAQHGTISLGSDMKAARAEILNRDMAAAQSDIARLSNRLKETSGGKTGGAQSLGDVLTSERINALKKAETNAAITLDAMAQRYGEKHPKMIAAQSDLARIRGDIARETRRIVQSIEHDLAEATARLETLQNQIDAMGAGADEDGRLKLELRNLEMEVAVNDRLYADFLIKYQDMLAQTELRVADMKVISMATIPSEPDHKARFSAVLALALIGFLIGLTVVVLRILWARGFHDASQLEGMTGYPVFGAVPMKGARGSASVHHHVVHDPAAVLAESLRSLRIALRLRGETGRRPRVVAFTSTLPDEGKTSLSVMLATIAAKSGERVCVVDCDLRRPSLHKAFGIGNARGLTDFLSDRLSMDEVIYRKDPSGVHLVTAKAVPSYSLTLLTSGRMERLIEHLRENYDLVILDAPSSLAFADARVLARMVDQTLYVVAWSRTRRDSVMASLKAYADMGYADLALVLNKVDLAEYLRDSAAAVVYQYGLEQQSDRHAA